MARTGGLTPRRSPNVRLMYSPIDEVYKSRKILRKWLPKALPLPDDKWHVFVNVSDVAAHHPAHGDSPAAIVLARPGERLGRELPQHPGKLPPTDFQQEESVFEVLVVREEFLDVGRFVGIEKGWVVFGEHSLHPVDADHVAIGDVDDDFEDRPLAGPGPGGEVVVREPGNSSPEAGGSAFVLVNCLRGQGVASLGVREKE